MPQAELFTRMDEIDHVDFPDLSLQIGDKPDPRLKDLRARILDCLESMEFHIANDITILGHINKAEQVFSRDDVRKSLEWLDQVGGMIKCHGFVTLMVASLTDRGLAYIHHIKQQSP